MIYQSALGCGHVLTFDEIPPKVDQVVWCRRCDAPSVVTARGRRVKEPHKRDKTAA